MFETILTLLLMVSILGIAYCVYQFVRNEAIFKIRTKWIKTDDKRYNKYSYGFMFNPSLHNWFGIKYPQDKHYCV